MHKRLRSQKELQQIAAQLRPGWAKGDPVAHFLRRALPTIDKLVHLDLVSIRDIASVLNLVGITYQIGHAWNPGTLRKELGEARARRDQASASSAPLERRQQATKSKAKPCSGYSRSTPATLRRPRGAQGSVANFRGLSGCGMIGRA